MKKKKVYHRTIKIKLFSTKKKQRQINAIIFAYRKAVNFYLTELQSNANAKLDGETLGKLTNSKLSERYKSDALKQAIGIFNSNFSKKQLRTKKQIVFNGYPTLDAKVMQIIENPFLKKYDLLIKLSTLSKGNPIYLPSKKTKLFNKWNNKGKLIQGCQLRENYIYLFVECESKIKETGNSIGVDLGMRKLLSTSDNQFIGKDHNFYLNKINRKKKNSIGYKKAVIEKNNFTNYCVNQLDLTNVNVLCYENLKNLTKGKAGFRQNKKFRNKQQHWAYRKVISRIIEKCQENCVRPVYVNPRNTSRTCPSCKHVAESNRIGELFCCLACGFKQDADFVGATNILLNGTNWLRSLESLNNKSKS